MAFLVLTSASCSNMTKEQDMTTLYEKLKGDKGGGALFDNLTPDKIDTKMTGVTANSIQLSKLKAGSVFIFKGNFAGGATYYGKILVTKVESDKFEFRSVLYNPNKSVAAEDDDKSLSSGFEYLGVVFYAAGGQADWVQIKMDGSGKIQLDTTLSGGTPTNILLLN